MIATGYFVNPYLIIIQYPQENFERSMHFTVLLILL